MPKDTVYDPIYLWTLRLNELAIPKAGAIPPAAVVDSFLGPTY